MKRTVSVILVTLLLLATPFGLFARAGDLPPIALTTKRPRMAGDANIDGTVDLRDTVAVARFLAGGWNVTIDESNADVNGDKTVNLKDVVILRRYLANWSNVTLQ